VVVHLDHVGQVDQPRGHQDLLAAGALGHALTVPPFERLLDAVPDPLGQAQPLGQAVRGPPVVLQHRLGGPPAVTGEAHAQLHPLAGRAARAQVPQHEQRPGRGRAEVHQAEVGLQRQVVAEPAGLLVGVHVAAHPGQQRRVEDHLAVGRVQAHRLGQPQRDQALPQHVLHRLAHAQVGAQRQHGKQLGQPYSACWLAPGRWRAAAFPPRSHRRSFVAPASLVRKTAPAAPSLAQLSGTGDVLGPDRDLVQRQPGGRPDRGHDGRP
jgi:hypothetical protein